MGDVVTPDVRSRMMSGIRGKNTGPELIVRRQLHELGFRYRLHVRELPGKPDLVFPRYGAVVFVHGCFWHGHDCQLFKWPTTRTSFWKAKIEGNRSTDLRNAVALRSSGWRVGIVWECALKGRGRHPEHDVAARCAQWLRSSRKDIEIKGT